MSSDTFGIGDLTQTAGSAFGIYRGASSGKATGQAGAAIGATKVAGQVSGNSQLAGAATQAADVLGIYTGVQQGGVAGYAQAANSAYGLATGSSGIPGVGQALAITNFVQGWQSGDTGGDALRGAQAGASIGSVVPGVGTLIGAGIGAAVGALSSVFGPGKVDPENVPFEGYTQAFNKLNGNTAAQQQLAGMVTNPYLPLAGLFDLRSGQIKGTIPFYNQYGRMGEQRFVTDMTTQINQAAQQGVISKNDTAQTVYNKVVAPWINKMGQWQDSNKGAMQGLLQQMVSQYMSGSAQQNWKAVGGQQAFANLPKYGANGFGTNNAEQVVQQRVAMPLHSAVMTFPGSTPAAGATSSSSSSGMLPLIMAGVGAMAGSAATGISGPAQVGNTGTDDSAGGTSGTDTSFLSGLGSGISNFLSSPAGNLAEFGTLAGLGESQASQQKQENQQQAGSISTLGTPYSQAGAAELSQLQGGPQMGGPIGQSVADQTTTAGNLAQVAKQYSTGNLTSAQNQQVSDYVKQQRAMVDSQLASSGNTDGSAKDAAYQQIDNNAAQLTQQLTQGNLQISQQALTTVQQTYNGLLNQALTSSEFGLGAQEQAVQLLIQGDTQVSQSLNQLFAGIAQGFGTAMGGSRSSQPGTGTSGAVGQIGRAVAGQGGGGVSSSSAGGAWDPNAGTLPGGYGASNEMQNEVSSQLSSETGLQEMSNQTDIQTQLDQSMYTPDTSYLNNTVNFGGDPFGE